MKKKVSVVSATQVTEEVKKRCDNWTMNLSIKKEIKEEKTGWKEERNWERKRKSDHGKMADVREKKI